MSNGIPSELPARPDNDFIDEEKIGTELAQRAVDRLFSVVERQAKKWSAQYKNITRTSFAKYLRMRQRRARQIRNFIYDIESVPLENIYVPLNLVTNKQERISDQKLVSSICNNHGKSIPKTFAGSQRPTLAAVIRGVGGSGKSILMRWCFLQICRRDQSRIPLFIELRDFNDARPFDIVALIQREFEAHDALISEEQVTLGLKSGLFILLFDGVDEIRPKYERHYYDVITGCAKQYEQCPMVVSGRPLSEMLAWSDFKIWTIDELDRAGVEALVQKLRFNEEDKLDFIDACRNGLFNTHKSFLEVPLLVVVMMLTFSHNKKISDARHEFYEDAFEALWDKHDARKEGFQRRHYCDLDKQKFLDLLSAFSASAYVRDKISFRDTDFEKHMGNAKRLTGITVKNENFLLDLTKSTSLCIKEEGRLKFCHRTFQEYFCALFVVKQTGGVAQAAINEFARRWHRDSVISLVKSLDEEKFERHFVLTSLSAFVLRAEKKRSVKAQLSFIEEGGDALRCIRDLYDFNPSNDDLDGAIAAFKDMGKAPMGKFHNILEKDIRNFVSLYEFVSSKLASCDSSRNSIFGNLD